MRILKEKRKTPCMDVKIQKRMKKYSLLQSISFHVYFGRRFYCTSVFAFKHNLCIQGQSVTQTGMIHSIQVSSLLFEHPRKISTSKSLHFFVPSALSALPPKYLHGLFPHFFQNLTVTITVGAFQTSVSKMSKPSYENFITPFSLPFTTI